MGLRDVTRTGPLPPELSRLLAQIVCLAETPSDRYAALLEEAGFGIDRIEMHAEALRLMVRNVQARLLGADLIPKVKNIELPGVDLGQDKSVAASAAGPALWRSDRLVGFGRSSSLSCLRQCPQAQVGGQSKECLG